MSIKRKRFYVYVIQDPRPNKRNVPIYVGKGNGRRSNIYLRNPRKQSNPGLRSFLINCEQLGLVPIIKRVAYFTLEESAFKREVELIAKYGRMDLGTGTLFNLTNGGNGIRGRYYTNTVRKQIGERIRKQWENPTYRSAISSSLRREGAKINADPTFRAAQSKRLRKEYTNSNTPRMIALKRVLVSDEFRIAQSRRLIELNVKLLSNPEYRAALATRNRKIARSSKNRAARSRRALKQWADPSIAKSRREHLRERNKSLMSRQNISRRAKLRWANPHCRARMLAAIKAGWITRRKNAA